MEILAPITVEKDKAFYPFAILEAIPVSANTGVHLPAPFPIVEAPLDLTVYEDFNGVKGSILLAAIPESMRANIRLWSEPCGSQVRAERNQGKVALTLGTSFKISTLEQFLKVFRYGMEVNYSPFDQPIRIINGYVLGYSYFQCAGVNKWVGYYQDLLARSPDGVLLTNYKSEGNTGGNISTRNPYELLPQDIDKIHDIRARIIIPPFGYQTAEEIMARLAPRFPSTDWFREKHRHLFRPKT